MDERLKIKWNAVIFKHHTLNYTDAVSALGVCQSENPGNFEVMDFGCVWKVNHCTSAHDTRIHWIALEKVGVLKSPV